VVKIQLTTDNTGGQLAISCCLQSVCCDSCESASDFDECAVVKQVSHFTAAVETKLPAKLTGIADADIRILRSFSLFAKTPGSLGLRCDQGCHVIVS